ncbi:hypothetical protein [Streptomyces halstedii]|uniref:Uncharacterized protein n=1 Tax=Streptomyces halstedii TaxID=1944 RepID=A0A6N9U766_STRHA|nr:hypothetical protein [Streptomyces halstedii]MBV7674038.1 hypothetical protein [Streptomyces halstedii]NEA17766.1 hypothetical protein [Streptomyces halstedii]
MPRMLDVSEDVRAEIGDAEADRLLVGDSAPGSYDCTSCRTPGDSDQERTSTVLFVGDETAVLAFAHATCIPSQVVNVAEDQLKGAMRSITGDESQTPEGLMPEQAVLGITSGLVLIEDDLRPALVVEPTGPIARPGTDGRGGDQFLQLLLEQGFQPTQDMNRLPGVLPGWSVLLAAGRLHAVLQPGPGGGQVAWWQAHQPLQVTEGWRTAANKSQSVLVFAAPVGSIGQQPREDLLRDALDKAAANAVLVAATMPLAGT